jgi:hypothetical protein
MKNCSGVESNPTRFKKNTHNQWKTTTFTYLVWFFGERVALVEQDVVLFAVVLSVDDPTAQFVRFFGEFGELKLIKNYETNKSMKKDKLQGCKQQQQWVHTYLYSGSQIKF